jgi:Short C-terminal domain
MNEGDATPKRGRRALPLALVIVASIILLVTAFAIWAKRQVLETDTWVETSGELLANESIRNALADFLVLELYENVDVEAVIAEPLPERVKPLAGPVSGALRQLAGEVARRALAQEQVQELWENANRVAHDRLLAIIEDEGEVVATTGGNVTIDLKQLLGAITENLGVGAGLVAKLPPEAAQLQVAESDELDKVQTGLEIFRAVAWFLVVLALLLYVLAVYLAGARRRETLRAVGISFIVVGAAIMVGHRVGGNVVVGALSEAASADDAVQATWDIGTGQLTDIANGLLLYGILIVIAAWLAGPTSIATSIRSAITPWLRRPAYAYGGAIALLILLFWWDPTPATHRLVPSLLLIVLVLLGTEVLRRQVIREFPDRVTTGSAAGVAQALAERMREARERRVASAEPAAAAAPSPAGDARVAELERLAKLRDSEVLTEEEFAAEKQRLLGS